MTEPIKYIVVHHTAGNKNSTMEEEKAAHIASGEFKDIAYNAVIEWDGTFKLGRNPKTTPFDRNAANEGLNHCSLSIVLIGNFELYDPNPIQLKKLEQVCAAWCKEYKIPETRIIGHYEVSKLIKDPSLATACPGKHCIKYMENLRKSVKKYLIIKK